jgi:hypothetical protein
MDLASLLIQLISGAVGGNVAGAVNKAKTLGPLINTIPGAPLPIIVGMLMMKSA